MTTNSADAKTTGRRTLVGKVVSAKMDKTAVVEVMRTVKHRRYHKYIQRRKTYLAHDESNACKEGDEVQIQESRPLSRRKRWVILDTNEA
jgi:small subunit ribosomal protein S17